MLCACSGFCYQHQRRLIGNVQLIISGHKTIARKFQLILRRGVPRAEALAQLARPEVNPQVL